MKHVLVAGASGVVGQAALRHFADAPGTRLTGIARRPPVAPCDAAFVSLDLTDTAACGTALASVEPVTHLVYAALHEKPGLAAGWLDADQIATNAAMLANLLDAATRGGALRHVTLLQGAKAYGAHVRAMPVPAREDRDEWRSVPNFYWEQERLLREAAGRHGWRWTILRPQVIFGEAIGAAMNPIPALGAWAAVLKEQGRPLAFPGVRGAIAQATDADLLAAAIGWAGEAPGAAGECFNVTNGDVFSWAAVWPAIAEALGMETAPDQPNSIAAMLEANGEAWDRVRARHRLAAPALHAFVGQSHHYMDILLGHGRADPRPPSLMSDVKLRQAGFHRVIDTEAMLLKWFGALQARRLLPPR